MITLKEERATYEVSGPYTEMQDIIPVLKRMKFRWDGSTKTWWIDKDRLSDRSREKLTEIIEGSPGKAVDKLRQVEEKARPFIDAVHKLKHFRVEVRQNGFTIRGPMKKSMDLVEACGGRQQGETNEYVFPYASLKTDGLDELAKSMADRDERISFNEMAVRDAVISVATKSWVSGTVSISLQGDVVIMRTPYALNHLVKNNFSNPRWDPSARMWYVKTTSVSPDQIKEFVSDAEAASKEREREEKSEASKYPYVFSVGSGYGGREFKEGEVVRSPSANIGKGWPEYLYVLKAEKRYVREDGLSFGVGDDSGYIYTAYCREATADEAMPVIVQEQARLKKNEAKAEVDRMVAMFRREGQRPPGANRVGGTWYLFRGANTVIVGGGEWFVVDGSDVWYVQNNGSDGADWSQNNVMTGGAGAIGWRIRDKDIADYIVLLMESVGAEKT